MGDIARFHGGLEIVGGMAVIVGRQAQAKWQKKISADDDATSGSVGTNLKAISN